MDELKSPADIIRLPSTLEEQNHMIETLREKFKGVRDPSELDATTEKQSIPARLLNFYLATTVDLSVMGLGKAVYIPVQVAEREGGRKSVYFLGQGEEVLTGIYVTSEGLALSFVKRATGSSVPARDGDVYCTTIKSRDGKLVFESQEELQEFDSQAGTGQFVPTSSTEPSNTLLVAAGTPRHCLFFSLFWQ